MTKTIDFLKLMADGRKRTAPFIAELTGWDVALVRAMVSDFRASGHLTLAGKSPSRYRITALGMERAKFSPKPRAQIAKESKARKARREEVERMAGMPAKFNVQQIVSRQPDLVQAWGSHVHA